MASGGVGRGVVCRVVSRDAFLATVVLSGVPVGSWSCRDTSWRRWIGDRPCTAVVERGVAERRALSPLALKGRIF